MFEESRVYFFVDYGWKLYVNLILDSLSLSEAEAYILASSTHKPKHEKVSLVQSDIYFHYKLQETS